MFNGYNDASLISYNESNQDRESKQENLSKWPYGRVTTVPPTQPHTTNLHSEFWPSKPNILGFSSAVNVTSKCNCSGCYSLDSYQGDLTRHRPWLPKTFSVPPHGSSESGKLPGSQWPCYSFTNQTTVLPENSISSVQYLPENGGKRMCFRHVQNNSQSVKITSLKSPYFGKKEILLKQKDEISQSSSSQEPPFSEQNNLSQALYGPAYGVTKSVEKKFDGRNYDTSFCDSDNKYDVTENNKLSSNAASYASDQYSFRSSASEPYVKTNQFVPSDLNQSRVPLMGHRSLMDNISQDQESYYNSTKFLTAEVGQKFSDEKTLKNCFQTPIAKDGTLPENFYTHMQGSQSSMATDLKNNELHFDLGKDLSKLHTNNPDVEAQNDHFSKSHFSDMIKWNSHTFLHDGKKDCTTLNYIGQLSFPEHQHNDLQRAKPVTNVSKFVDMNNTKTSLAGFYPKEVTTEKISKSEYGYFPENLPFSRRKEHLLKTENYNWHARFPRPPLIFNNSGDLCLIDKAQSAPLPCQNNMVVPRNFVRPEYSYQGCNVQNQYEYSNELTKLTNTNNLQRNDFNQYSCRSLSQRIAGCGDVDQHFASAPNDPYICDSFYQKLENHDKTFSQPYCRGEENVPSSTPDMYPAMPQNYLEIPKSNNCVQQRSYNQIMPNHQKNVQDEALKKSGSNKISPLRLLRKKKVTNEKNEVNVKSPVNINNSEMVSTLDVRKYWSTWADEEEENTVPSQMVILDCQNIDPDQIKLLHLCGNDPSRLLDLENISVTTVKDTEYEKESANILSPFSEDNVSTVHTNSGVHLEFMDSKNEVTEMASQIHPENTRGAGTPKPKKPLTQQNTQEMPLETVVDIIAKNEKDVLSGVAASSVKSDEAQLLESENFSFKSPDTPKGGAGAIHCKKFNIPKENDKGNRLDKWTEKKFDFLKRAELSKAAELLKNEEEKKKIYDNRFSYQRKNGNLEAMEASENFSCQATIVPGKIILMNGKINKSKTEAPEEISLDPTVLLRDRTEKIDSPSSRKSETEATSSECRSEFSGHSDREILSSDGYAHPENSNPCKKISNVQEVNETLEKTSVTEHYYKSHRSPFSADADDLAGQKDTKEEHSSKNNLFLNELSSGDPNKSDIHTLMSDEFISDGSKPKSEDALQNDQMNDVSQKIRKMNFQGSEVESNLDDSATVNAKTEKELMEFPVDKSSKKEKINLQQVGNDRTDEIMLQNISASEPTIKFSIQKSHDLKISFKVLNGRTCKTHERFHKDEEVHEIPEKDNSETSAGRPGDINETKLITLKLKSIHKDYWTSDGKTPDKRKITLGKTKRKKKNGKNGAEASKRHSFKIKKNTLTVPREGQNRPSEASDTDNCLILSCNNYASNNFQVKQSGHSEKIKLTLKKQKTDFGKEYKISDDLPKTFKEKSHSDKSEFNGSQPDLEVDDSFGNEFQCDTSDTGAKGENEVKKPLCAHYFQKSSKKKYGASPMDNNSSGDCRLEEYKKDAIVTDRNVQSERCTKEVKDDDFDVNECFIEEAFEDSKFMTEIKFNDRENIKNEGSQVEVDAVVNELINCDESDEATIKYSSFNTSDTVVIDREAVNVEEPEPGKADSREPSSPEGEKMTPKNLKCFEAVAALEVHSSVEGFENESVFEKHSATLNCNKDEEINNFLISRETTPKNMHFENILRCEISRAPSTRPVNIGSYENFQEVRVNKLSNLKNNISSVFCSSSSNDARKAKLCIRITDDNKNDRKECEVREVHNYISEVMGSELYEKTLKSSSCNNVENRVIRNECDSGDNTENEAKPIGQKKKSYGPLEGCHGYNIDQVIREFMSDEESGDSSNNIDGNDQCHTKEIVKIPNVAHKCSVALLGTSEKLYPGCFPSGKEIRVKSLLETFEIPHGDTVDATDGDKKTSDAGVQESDCFTKKMSESPFQMTGDVVSECTNENENFGVGDIEKEQDFLKQITGIGCTDKETTIFGDDHEKGKHEKLFDKTVEGSGTSLLITETDMKYKKEIKDRSDTPRSFHVGMTNGQKFESEKIEYDIFKEFFDSGSDSNSGRRVRGQIEPEIHLRSKRSKYGASFCINKKSSTEIFDINKKKGESDSVDVNVYLNIQGSRRDALESNTFNKPAKKIDRRHSLMSEYYFISNRDEVNSSCAPSRLKWQRNKSFAKFKYSDCESNSFVRAGSCPPLAFSPEIQTGTPALGIPVKDIPLPPGDPPPENCFNLDETVKKRRVASTHLNDGFFQCSGPCENSPTGRNSPGKNKTKELRIWNSLRPLKAVKENRKVFKGKIKNERTKNEKKQICSSSEGMSECDVGEKPDTENSISQMKREEITCETLNLYKGIASSCEGEPFRNADASEGNDIPIARMEHESTDFDEIPSSLLDSAVESSCSVIGGSDFIKTKFYECEDIPTSEDLPNENEIEEEKVSDDDKFRHMMQNCLDNAKRFLNVSNLKLFSCSVEDLLELDGQLTDTRPEVEKKTVDSSNHISRDVLLTSCEDTAREDLGLSEKFQPAELSVDFVPSFDSENSLTLCPEILPVDNWPYLEEEVPSSPSKPDVEEPELIPSLENTICAEKARSHGDHFLKEVLENKDISQTHFGPKAAQNADIDGELQKTYTKKKASNVDNDMRFRRKNFAEEFVGNSKSNEKRRNTANNFAENGLSDPPKRGENANNFKAEMPNGKNRSIKIERSWHKNECLKYKLNLKKFMDKGRGNKEKKEVHSRDEYKNDSFRHANLKDVDRLFQTRKCSKSPSKSSNRDEAKEEYSKETEGISLISLQEKYNANYESPNWQPKVVLFRISKKDLKIFQRSGHEKGGRFPLNQKPATNEISKGLHLDEVATCQARKRTNLDATSKSHHLKKNFQSKKPMLQISDQTRNSDKSKSRMSNGEESRLCVNREENTDDVSKTDFAGKGKESECKRSGDGSPSQKEPATVNIDRKGVIAYPKAGSSISNGSPFFKVKKSRFRNLHKKRKISTKDIYSSCRILKKKNLFFDGTSALSKMFDESDQPAHTLTYQNADSLLPLHGKYARTDRAERFVGNRDTSRLTRDIGKCNGEELFFENLPERPVAKTRSFKSPDNSRQNKVHLRKETLNLSRRGVEMTSSSAKTVPGQGSDDVKTDHGTVVQKKLNGVPEHGDKSMASANEKSRGNARKKLVNKVKYEEHARKNERRNVSFGGGSAAGGICSSKKQVKERKLEEKSVGDYLSDCCGDSDWPWICEVCGFNNANDRISHIKSHPFHCQSCHLAFKTEARFISHLTDKHENIRNQHHCLLCEMSFDTEELHSHHLETREHKHLETVEKNTINTLFTLLTGQPCPVLGLVEMKPEWLPNQPGTVHFYHQATPLSLALQYLKMHHDFQRFAKVPSSLSN